MGVVKQLSDYRRPDRAAERPEATGKGFALLHRKIQETEFYRKDSQAVHLWIHLILSVNHAPEKVFTDYGDVVVERGQLITGAPTLEKETGIELERVKYLLRKFKKLGMISTFSPGKFTLITIVKYDEYQGDFTPKSFPQVSLEIPPDNPEPMRLTGDSVTQDSLTIPTNNNITNKSLSNDKDMSSGDDQFGQRKTAKKPKSKTIPYQAVLDAYNEVVGDKLPNAEALNDKRKRGIKRLLAELKEPTVVAAKNYFGAFVSHAKPFYFGENNTGWQANFDYLLRSETLVKTREGSL